MWLRTHSWPLHRTAAHPVSAHLPAAKCSECSAITTHLHSRSFQVALLSSSLQNLSFAQLGLCWFLPIQPHGRLPAAFQQAVNATGLLESWPQAIALLPRPSYYVCPWLLALPLQSHHLLSTPHHISTTPGRFITVSLKQTVIRPVPAPTGVCCESPQSLCCYWVWRTIAVLFLFIPWPPQTDHKPPKSVSDTRLKSFTVVTYNIHTFIKLLLKTTLLISTTSRLFSFEWSLRTAGDGSFRSCIWSCHDLMPSPPPAAPEAKPLFIRRQPWTGTQWAHWERAPAAQALGVCTELPRRCSPRVIQHQHHGDTDPDPLLGDMALLLGSRTPQRLGRKNSLRAHCHLWGFRPTFFLLHLGSDVIEAQNLFFSISFHMGVSSSKIPESLMLPQCLLPGTLRITHITNTYFFFFFSSYFWFCKFPLAP